MDTTAFTFAISALSLGSLGFIFGVLANSQLKELKKKMELLEKKIEMLENSSSPKEE